MLITFQQKLGTDHYFFIGGGGEGLPFLGLAHNIFSKE